MERINMTAEELFLRYALPCLDDLCNIHKITPKKKDEIEQKFYAHETISKQELEEIFPAAFRRMQESFGKDYWTPSKISEYFRKYHDEFIDSGDGRYREATETIKYWCKVREAVVDSVRDNCVVLLSYEHDPKFDSSRLFFNKYQLELKPGDKVITHWRFVIEKLE